jgi:hypothetical protein
MHPTTDTITYPFETVWKIKTGVIWSRTSGQIGISTLYLAVLLLETTFNEPSCYFIDSPRRRLLGL